MCLVSDYRVWRSSFDTLVVTTYKQLRNVLGEQGVSDAKPNALAASSHNGDLTTEVWNLLEVEIVLLGDQAVSWSTKVFRYFVPDKLHG